MRRSHNMAYLFSANGGSVIIGVLMAMVFIGIVTSSILRNTMSQSAASADYGLLTLVDLTASSGMIATQSYISRPANAGEVIDILQGYVDDPGRPAAAIFPKNGVGKVKLTDGQFFSSKLTGFDKHSFISKFEIGSGRGAAGRDLKKGVAFYTMGNMEIEKDSYNYGARNAVYMRGELGHGNNGMEVKDGSATFEGYVKFQNRPAIFHEDAYFNEDVDIMHRPEFKGKAYFNKNVNMQNLNGEISIFKSSVGLNGNISTSSGTAQDIAVGGIFWHNGSFGSGANFDGFKLRGEAGNKFYYSDKLPVQTQAQPQLCNVWNCPNISNGSGLHPCRCLASPAAPQHPGDCDWRCEPLWGSMNYVCKAHLLGHINIGPGDDRIGDDFGSRVHGFAEDDRTRFSGKGILDSLKMDTISARRDPQLDISKIPSGKIGLAVDAAAGAGGGFSVKKLNDAYDAAMANDQLYNDHLVLKIRPNDLLNFPMAHDAVFDKKVIFIVEDGAVLNPGGRFYHCSGNSSTLIYAGAGNATLQQFGSSGLFRGLIYIDSLNTSENNTFFWDNGGRIEGAFHSFSAKKFLWNTNGSQPTSITFDTDVLNAFGFLVKGAVAGGPGAGAETIKLTAGEDRIKVIPIGFYFH